MIIAQWNKVELNQFTAWMVMEKMTTDFNEWISKEIPNISLVDHYQNFLRFEIKG